MADPASQAKLKALAEYFRNGGQDPRVAQAQPMGQPDQSGRLSAAPPVPPMESTGGGMPMPNSPPMGMGAGTLDQMAAARAKQLELNNLASQPPPPDFDASGYTAYPGPRQFPNIQKKVQAGQPINSQDIRDTMHGVQEVTPELEKKLGYGKQDEDEE